jgi:hypothetical protein
MRVLFFNRFSIAGFFLLVLGFLLLPFIVGIFLIPPGVLLLVIGLGLAVWRIIPGHKQLEPKIQTFVNQYIDSSTTLSLIFRRKPRPPV